jgi:prepilin-type processing-associated H-X9-DG protein
VFATGLFGRRRRQAGAQLACFVEGKAIYDQYHFDEPWDGPNNRKLHRQSVFAYKCPSDRDSRPATETSYIAIVGPHVAWPGASSRRLSDVGHTADTILVAEVRGSGIHWLEPRDLDASRMALEINSTVGQGISSRHTAGAHVCMMDGSVRFLSDRTTSRELGPLLRISGRRQVARRPHHSDTNVAP